MKFSKKDCAPRVLALFSGAGGLDLGFSQAGFDVQVSSDIVPIFLETIKKNVGRYYDKTHHTVCADVSTIDPKELGEGPFDFMIGGPPCQSFSAAGRRAGGVHGVNDFRGSLFWHYCRLIEHYKPKGFLFENVRGLLQANKGHDWKLILDAFSNLGYKISHRVLDAADYGVPQHRERLIVVGLKDKEFLFPKPTHGPASGTGLSHVSVGEALNDLDNPSENVPIYPGKWGDLVMEVPPGMNYLYFTEEMGHPSPKFAWRSRFSDFLYKLDPALPSKTILASQGAYGGPFHWKGRKLTLAEHKRLQSFPDDYEFAGSLLVAIKQIGNSVAPRFALALAKAVKVQVFDAPTDLIELMESNHELVFDSRKREKAKRTRAGRLKPNEKHSDQLDLWGGKSELYPAQQSLNFEWGYNAPREQASHLSAAKKIFSVQASFNEGVWQVVANESNSENESYIHLNLDFSPSENRGFKKLDVKLNCFSLEYAAVAWDLIDWCVRSGSSFASIHPLYGHFTEPHPKFSLRIDAQDRLNSGLAEFINKTSSFDYVSSLRPSGELEELFPKNTHRETVLYLRGLGWDIRTHETNRAIPSGFFRSGYPFTISLAEPRYTTWRDKGSDRNADRSAIPLTV